tara:strand:+ start:8725 stop:8922 length:198 start_codon:yes stop_codon:yes gene_type:complete
MAYEGQAPDGVFTVAALPPFGTRCIAQYPDALVISHRFWLAVCTPCQLTDADALATSGHRKTPSK